MALTSCSRLMSSFDWQTALPQGQSNLPPSILVMSDSRQVLTMSQETSSPCGSLVARMSQILILQALRACFSARSSGVSSVLAASSARRCLGRGALARRRAGILRGRRPGRNQRREGCDQSDAGKCHGTPFCGPCPRGWRSMVGGRSGVQHVRPGYFAMRSSAEIMALPISAVPMVRQPSCAMSAVR